VNNLDDTPYDEEDDNDNDNDDEDYADDGVGDTFEDIRSRLRQVQSSCKSTVPVEYRKYRSTSLGEDYGIM
jgi:hypothetical protein